MKVSDLVALLKAVPQTSDVLFQLEGMPAITIERMSIRAEIEITRNNMNTAPTKRQSKEYIVLS